LDFVGIFLAPTPERRQKWYGDDWEKGIVLVVKTKRVAPCCATPAKIKNLEVSEGNS
jgi:hypothetical protein